jgi:putative flippase GtrA
VIRELLRHSAARYVLVGGLSYVTDAGGLWLLHGVAGVPLAAATTVAYAASFAVNFGLNRSVVFPGGARMGPQLVRYVILVIANYLATMVMVLGLSGAGLNYLAAKTVTVVVLAIANYFLYRHWVFATRRTPLAGRSEPLERELT